MKKIIILFILISSVNAETIEERINKLENDILDLKLKNIDNNKLSIGGAFHNTYRQNYYDEKNALIPKDSYSSIFSKFLISFDKTNRKKVKFYSLIGASYLWNNTFQTPTVVTDFLQESDIRGSYFFVEKAYLDYFILEKSLSFSLGRLPSQYGPPFHFSVNQDRLGTYPGMVYSVPLDGIALTFNAKNYFKTIDRYVFRLIFSPLYNITSGGAEPNTLGRERNFQNIDTKEGKVIHFNFEYGSKFNFAESLFIAQVFHGKFGRPKTIDNIRGLFNSSLAKLGGTDRNVYEIGSRSEEQAEVNAANLYFEFNSLFRSKLDLYGNYRYTKFNSTGDMVATLVEANTPISSLGLNSAGDTVSLGGFVYDESTSGSSVLLGSRFRFSDSFNLGIEYINNSFGYFPSAIRNIQSLEFYNIIGNGKHIYMNYKLENNLNITLGLNENQIDARFQTISFIKVDGTYKNLYTHLSLLF